MFRLKQSKLKSKFLNIRYQNIFWKSDTELISIL